MTNSTTETPNATNPRRKQILQRLLLAFGVAGVAYGTWWAAFERHHVKTDNAYVMGNLVQVTPQIAGTVVAIRADDTERVEAGQPLVMLDPADTRIALDQADAALAQAVRETRQLYANQGAAQAQLKQREAESQRAAEDLQRRQSLADSGAIAAEELDHARRAAQAATAALAVAREQLAAISALTDNVTLEEHPNLQRATAKYREAFLAWKRASLPAPVSGYVAKRSVQVGQRIQPGAPLLAIVPLDGVWVEANFKESQLERVRLGQPVTLKADVYGSSVSYHGKVLGLAAGTGAVFSLLPAQNATGNWIKVVQRVPVRITLDPKELAEHPLRVGLSMEAEIDARDDSGPALATASRQGEEHAYVTRALSIDEREAEQRIAKLFKANGLVAPKAASHAAKSAHSA
jgi:membrane fusion protein (multidrug efflux system)